MLSKGYLASTAASYSPRSFFLCCQSNTPFSNNSISANSLTANFPGLPHTLFFNIQSQRFQKHFESCLFSALLWSGQSWADFQKHLNVVCSQPVVNNIFKDAILYISAAPYQRLSQRLAHL